MANVISKDWASFTAKDYAQIKKDIALGMDSYFQANQDKNPLDRKEISLAVNYVLDNNPAIREQLLNLVHKMIQGYPRADSPEETADLRAGSQAQYKDTGYRPKDGMSTPGINQAQNSLSADPSNPSAENKNELKLGMYAKFKMSAPKLEAQLKKDLKKELKEEYVPKTRLTMG